MLAQHLPLHSLIRSIGARHSTTRRDLALSRKLFNHLGTDFCLEALDAPAWAVETEVSRSGRKSWHGHIMVERLWSPVKHKEVHLHAYGDGREAEISLVLIFWKHRHARPHGSPGRRRPNLSATSHRGQTSRQPHLEA